VGRSDVVLHTNTYVLHCPVPVTQISQSADNSRFSPRRYELTDHLGSVRGVISDMKLPDGGGGFRSELYTVAEYDAYGMERPNRSVVLAGTAGFYR